MSTPPLTGIRVLELTWNLPGPYTGFLLASLGARVLKVEPPRGDPARAMPRLFETLNRGKESRVLDLRTPEARDRLLGLVDDVDVVLEGFRPGVAARLGCDAETVRRRNPEVVYCSISAFGQHGPRRDVPGHDLNAQALAGLCWLARDASGRPHGLPLPVADLSVALSAAASICAALFAREKSAGGASLDVAMVDAVTSWTALWSEGVDLAADARSRVPAGLEPLARRAVLERLDRERLHALPHYDVYRCRDGTWLAIGIVDERKFWVALCEVLGLRRFAALSLPARAAMGPVLKPMLAWALRRRPRDHWLQRLGAADLPVAPVLTPGEALAEPHLAERLVNEHGVVRAPLAGARFLDGAAPALRDDALS